MSEGLLLVLLVGFAYRVTRLVTTDDITFRLRDWAGWRVTQLDSTGHPMTKSERPYLHTLVTCDWCASVWISLATVLAYHFAVAELSAPWWLWVGAVATGVGIVSKLVDD